MISLPESSLLQTNLWPACPDWLPAFARRTNRLAHAQQSVAMMLGGQAGSRLLTHLYMPTSHDTLLRLIRKWQSGDPQTPHALGVDDWAIRKAKTYGTILVDLDKHQPIDLLEGWTAEGLRDWLKVHPGIEVITATAARKQIVQASMLGVLVKGLQKLYKWPTDGTYFKTWSRFWREY